MAVLTGLDKTEIKRSYFVPGRGKEHFKGASNPSMDGDQLLAVLQAIEDDWETTKVARRAKINVAAGKSLTNGQVAVLERGWLQFKARRIV